MSYCNYDQHFRVSYTNNHAILKKAEGDIQMLTKPEYGWTDFHLEGTSVYGLSYLDDIAFEWLNQAIHGLQTMSPFCVKGFLEPGRFLCTVSYWNCHIVIENDERLPMEENELRHEYSHTSMLEFCRYLYQDIRESFEDWVFFADFIDNDDEEAIASKRDCLSKQLSLLSSLIDENRKCFDENHCFL